LGVTCIYLLTQVSPFDLFDMNQDAWVWRDYLVNNPVDEKLGKVLDKMIANVLPQRYQSAVEVIEVISLLDQKIYPLNIAPLTSITPDANFIISNPSQPIVEPTSFIQATSTKIIKSKFKFETAKIEVIIRKIPKTGFFSSGEEKTLKINTIQGEVEYITEDLGNNVKLEMVYVPAGSFMMGSSNEYDEKPIHNVSIPHFWMGKYTITQKQYQAIIGVNPSQFKSENRPVEQVNWNDADKFCKKLFELTGKKYTLPSESQWEYACRAGTNTAFYFGETITSDLANYDSRSAYRGSPKSESRKQTIDVGCFPPNAFGLYDMHGNVWEWCSDSWHGNYKGAPTDGSPWLYDYDSLHLPRGGSWNSSPENCRSANRNGNAQQSFRLDTYGFRVVCPICP
jgi:eukaryotic-like serine/threonine-protein kinase